MWSPSVYSQTGYQMTLKNALRCYKAPGAPPPSLLSQTPVDDVADAATKSVNDVADDTDDVPDGADAVPDNRWRRRVAEVEHRPYCLRNREILLRFFFAENSQVTLSKKTSIAKTVCFWNFLFVSFQKKYKTRGKRKVNQWRKLRLWAEALQHFASESTESWEITSKCHQLRIEYIESSVALSWKQGQVLWSSARNTCTWPSCALLCCKYYTRARSVMSTPKNTFNFRLVRVKIATPWFIYRPSDRKKSAEHDGSMKSLQFWRTSACGVKKHEADIRKVRDAMLFSALKHW